MSIKASRYELKAELAIEAGKLERLARQLREGKWDEINIEEIINRKGQGADAEKATVLIRVSRRQKLGRGLDISLDEEPTG